MESNVITIYLLLLLNYSLGENAETTAIRNKHKPDVLANKLMPQQVYTISNRVPIPNVTPALNRRLDNGLNNIPRIVVPVANTQKNVIIPNYSAPKVVIAKQTKKPESNTTPPTGHKEEKVKENVQEIKILKPKQPQFFEDEEKEDVRGFKTGTKQLPQENKSQTNIQDTQIEASKKTKTNKPTNKEKVYKLENPFKPVSSTLNEVKLVPPKDDKNIEIPPKNKTQDTVKDDILKTSGRRKCDSDGDTISSSTIDSNKATINVAIYTMGNEETYSNVPSDETKVYTDKTDFSKNEPTSNVVIKNQNIEEIRDRAQDTNIYDPDLPNDQYFNELPIYEPDAYAENISYEIPKYQDVFNTPMDLNNRVWRNWKTTEIYISNYQPRERFYDYVDKNNGLSTPFMNGFIGYDYKNSNAPSLYQCYAYPSYKHMY